MSAIFNSHLAMIVIVAITAIVGIVSVKYLGNDNPVEEIAEQVIKDTTGIDIDLTPSDTKTVPTSPVPVPSSSSSST